MQEHCTALAAAVQTGTLATVSELNLGLSSFHNDARYSLRDRLIAGCAMAYGVPASDVMQMRLLQNTGILRFSSLPGR